MAKEPSLTELRERLLKDGASIPPGLVASLESDGRAGAASLAKAIKARQAANRSEGQRLRHMLKFENELWAEGYKLIAGVDEAGAGPCAGPVVAGAAILPIGDTPYFVKATGPAKTIESHADAVLTFVKSAKAKKT